MSSITVDFSDLNNVTADVVLDGDSLEVTGDGLRVSNALLAVLAGTDVPAGGTTGQVLIKASDTDNDVEWATLTGGGGGGGGALDYIVIQDLKAQGTNGGVFSPGAWQTRDLNSEAVDTGGNASIASNQITLLAGTYRVRIKCPAFAVIRHQARLFDITHSALLLRGSSEYAFDNTAQSSSEIVGRITLAGTTVLEVQHQCESSGISDLGFGNSNSFGGGEVYTIAEFWKE